MNEKRDGFFFEPNAETAEKGSDRHAGIVVVHGGAGITEHERQRAQALADLGYVAFVPDLFGEKFETRARGIEVIMSFMSRPETLRARLHDALARLRSHELVDASRIGAIGFCFGGHAALEIARSDRDVRAVVTFHGGLTTQAPARLGEVNASILVCTGARDPFITREHRSAFEDEMENAKADFQIHLHAHAMHGFTERSAVERPGCAYDEHADTRTWDAMRAHFTQTWGTFEGR